MKKRIFAMFLSMTMVLAMFPATAFAAEANALPEAVNGVIKLVNDVNTDNTCALTVTQGQTLTLDLNGHNITSSSGNYTINNNGNLTIIGNGTIDNTSTASTTIRNNGTMTIGEEDGSKFPTVKCVDKTSIANSAVKCEENTTLTIWGGTFVGDHRAVQSWGKNVVINGGEFTGYVDSWKYQSNEELLTINGGTFNNAVRSCFDNDQGNSNFGKIVISGGELKGGVKYDHLNDAPLPEENTAFVTISGGNITGALANVETATFAVTGGTFEVATANDLQCVANIAIGPVTIKLVGGIDAADKTALRVDSGKNVTLDLNGYNITSSSGNYTINNNGNLTIIGNGTIDNTSTASTTIRNNGTMTIGEEDGSKFPTVKCVDKTSIANSAVKCEENTTLTIWGGTFVGDHRAVQSWGKNVVINGGEFTGYVDSWKYQSNEELLTINGGTFNNAVRSCFDNDQGNSNFGKIVISGGELKGGVKYDHLNDAPLPEENTAFVTISGGNITGALANVETATFAVTGGTFDSDPSKYVVDGYKAFEEGGSYTVVEHTCAWGEVTYDWAEDYTTCTATHTCNGEPTHTETAEATVTNVKVDATCTKAGSTTYTATFVGKDWAETQTKTVDIPVLEHEWAETTYTWAEDNSTCTAKRICAGEHEETAEATVTNVKVDATCTKAGSTTYTATFVGKDWAETQTKTVDIPVLEHEWAETTYTWAEDNSTCTAKRICAGEHEETAEATVTNVKVDATCTKAGSTTYTATFVGKDWAETQTKTVDIAINADAHSYGEWQKDEVNHKKVCANDESHVLTEAHQYDNDADDTCDICGYKRTTSTPSTPSTPSRPSTGGSSSGSSSGSTTTTEKNPDGSTTTTKVDKNGTVTETTKNKDGSTETVKTEKDGTVTTNVKAADGTKSETVVDKNGVQNSEVTVSNKAVKEAAAAGEAVALPIPEVKASSNSNKAATVTVDLPGNVKTAKVEVPVSNINAGTVAVIVHADGTEEVVRDCVPTEDGIALNVENGATVKIVDNSRDFADVSAAHSFSDAVDFASARGIVEGYSNGSFGVGGYATSAATATVIARIMGEDFYGSGSTTKAQNWAKENGIAAGLDLSGNVNRVDFMTMLWRAAGSPAANTTLSFTDASSIAAGAMDAMAWAVEVGLIGGYDDGSVRPNANITRGAMAAIAQRYMMAK